MRRFAFVGVPALLFASGGAAMTDPPAAPPVRYKFVENTDRWVRVIRGKWEFTGKLDKNGEFTQEFRAPAGGPATMMPPADLLAGPGQLGAAAKAYEIRFGTLIPGTLRKDGLFVPEVGGKVIKFADYKYSPEGPQIWNLPGWFVPDDPPAAKK
ncbi:MAG: hypothetical protein K2X82_17945 [Gemmataceae bacterium]|nr:hypothetical protein [Gemmataceae bacterium]